MMLRRELWDWNGPEEGDEIDQSVIVMHDGEEVFELVLGTVHQKKAAARKLVALLNKHGVTPL